MSVSADVTVIVAVPDVVPGVIVTVVPLIAAVATALFDVFTLKVPPDLLLVTVKLPVFGYVINLAFQNITLTNATVSGQYRVGALIGYADNMLIDSSGNPKMIEYGGITINNTKISAIAVAGGVVGEGYYIRSTGTNILKGKTTDAAAVQTTGSIPYNYYRLLVYIRNFFFLMLTTFFA